jgi:hypothetical protein
MNDTAREPEEEAGTGHRDEDDDRLPIGWLIFMVGFVRHPCANGAAHPPVASPKAEDLIDPISFLSLSNSEPPAARRCTEPGTPLQIKRAKSPPKSAEGEGVLKSELRATLGADRRTINRSIFVSL